MNINDAYKLVLNKLYSWVIQFIKLLLNLLSASFTCDWFFCFRLV